MHPMLDATFMRARRAASVLFVILGVGLLGLAACEGNFNSNAECIPQCGDRQCGGDGCGGTCGICGPGRACALDGTCRLASCGDGKLDPGEVCDNAIAADEEGACTTSDACVDDGNACTTEQFFGSAENCDAECTRFTIIRCENGDGCCPDGCNDGNDSDCSENCDNGVVDDNETCDPPSSCPTIADCTAPDACQRPILTGSASSCSAACATEDITACTDGDGCCPAGCTDADDDDCEPVQAVCNDGTLDQGENCDPGIAAGMPGACPADATECDDSDMCTTDDLQGMASDCSAECVNTPITACTNADGCCVTSCTPNMDDDCADLCTTFCTDVIATCVDANVVYADMNECMTACGDFVVGTNGDMTGDTLECRITHLGLAAADPDTHCSHTAVTSGPCS
jgi:hypothetical protein